MPFLPSLSTPRRACRRARAAWSWLGSVVVLGSLAPAPLLAAAPAPSETLLFFTVIGLGMALPYLLLSAFPRLAALLPRPGEWMETLKQAMAFPLFAYALFLLWVLSALVEEASWVRDASLGLAVIAAACWVWGRWGAPHRTDRERLVGKAVAALLYVGTLGYLYGTLA